MFEYLLISLQTGEIREQGEADGARIQTLIGVAPIQHNALWIRTARSTDSWVRLA